LAAHNVHKRRVPTNNDIVLVVTKDIEPIYKLKRTIAIITIAYSFAGRHIVFAFMFN
jgi:hypothetical protein